MPAEQNAGHVGSFEPAALSVSTRVSTAVVAIIFLGTLVMSFSGDGLVTRLICVALGLVLVGCWLFSVEGYLIDGKSIIVRHPFWSARYDGARLAAGLALYKEILSKYRRGKNMPLIRRVFAEFDFRPSGLVLPFGQLLHRRDGERIQRVAWKIVRGLHFHRTGEVLRSDLTVACTVTTPDDDKPPDHFIGFRDLPENPVLGQYPGVFAYRFQVFPENNAQYWALLLWDLIIVTVAFVP